MSHHRKLKLEELNRISVDEFHEASKTPLVVVLDNIRSGVNVGSVFRTSDAFRVQKMYLCGLTPKPPHKEIQKTAIGASRSVDWEYAENAIEVVRLLKKQGYKLLAVEQAANSIRLNELSSSMFEKVAIILGNEVEGVQQSLIDMADHVVEIEQFGTKHSLNISVCAGVVIYRVFHLLKRPFQTQ